MHFDSHTLPPLSTDEQLHSEQLIAVIRDELLRSQNWMGFDRYMELALYTPGLGYYSAGAHKLGAGGDFITAPEISPLFSKCVANQCVEVLRQMQGGDVLELGAGSGIMAADMLLHMESLGSLPDHYAILEVSADLQQRQQILLQDKAPHLVDRVKWLQSLPKNFTGIIVGNEVLDALPVKRFIVLNGAVCELGVSIQDEQFVWQPQPADTQLTESLDHIAAELGSHFADGYTSEVCLLLPSWINSLSDALARGAMIFIDYGLPRKHYYSAERTRGTLNCFFKHRQHENPFINIGLQDITSWVDFTALMEAAIHSELDLCGFSTQAHFLVGAGIEPLLHERMNQTDLSDTQRWKLSQQVQQLMLPDAMGETFKAMAFSKNCDLELSGFSFRDLRQSL